MGQLRNNFREAFLLGVIAIPLVAAATFAVRRHRHGPLDAIQRRWWFIDTTLVASAAVIMAFTLAPTGVPGSRRTELVPFSDPVIVEQLMANVALFVPLGFALALRLRSLVHVSASTAAVVVTVEVLQYLTGFGRAATTTDVVAAVVGGSIGGVAGWLVRPLVRPAADQPSHGGSDAHRLSSGL